MYYRLNLYPELLWLKLRQSKLKQGAWCPEKRCPVVKLWFLNNLYRLSHLPFLDLQMKEQNGVEQSASCIIVDLITLNSSITLFNVIRKTHFNFPAWSFWKARGTVENFSGISLLCFKVPTWSFVLFCFEICHGRDQLLISFNFK